MSGSKKLFRPLVVGAAVLAVLGGAYWALMSLPEGDGETPPPSPSAAADTETLFTLPGEGTPALTCTRTDAPSYELSLASTDAGSGEKTYRVTPGRKGFSYRQSLLGAVYSHLAALSGRVVVESPTAGQLAEYGLSEPVCRWTADGADAVLSVGGATALGDGYYAALSGRDAVFVISSSAGAALTRRETDLRALDMLPDIDTADPGATITKLRLVGQEDFTLRVVSIEDAPEDSPVYSPYEFLEPLKADASEYNVAQQVVGPISDINPSAVVEDDPADLSRYGFEGYRVEVTDTGGHVTVLLIGGVDAETGGRYLMYEGTDTVLLDTDGRYDFLKAHYPDLMNKTIWLYNISDLASMTVEWPDGAARTVSYGYEGEGDARVMTPALDGEDTSETNAKRLYQTVLGLYMQDLFEEPPAVAPAYRITLRFLSGEAAEMTLTPVNERVYAASVNGGPAMYAVGVRDVRRLDENFAAVDRGEELPSQV